METLQSLRANYPQYSELSDEELAQAYKNRHAPDMPQEEFDSQFMAHDFDVRNMMSNIPSSAAEYGADIYHAVTSPVDTLKGLGKAVIGGVQKLDPTDVLGTQYEPVAEAIGQDIADTYGSVDKFQRSLEQDPVGTAGDLSLMLSGVGSGLKAARLGKLADSVKRVGANIDPLAVTANTLRSTVKPITPKGWPQSIMERGVNLRPETARFLLDKNIPVTEAGMQRLKGMIPKERTIKQKVTDTQTVDTGLLDKRGNPITRTEPVTSVVEKTITPPNLEKYKAIQGDLAKAIARNPDWRRTVMDLATGTGVGGVAEYMTGIPGLTAGATIATIAGRLGTTPKNLSRLAQSIKQLKDQGYLEQFTRARPTKKRDIRNLLALAGEAQDEYLLNY